MRSRLQAAARRLGEARPEIEAVWLFGSIARGEATPGSDADILVVLDSSDLPFAERSLRYQLEECGLGVDVLAYTHTEIQRMRAEGSPFLRQIEGERVCLWKRADARHEAMTRAE